MQLLKFKFKQKLKIQFLSHNSPISTAQQLQRLVTRVLDRIVRGHFYHLRKFYWKALDIKCILQFNKSL